MCFHWRCRDLVFSHSLELKVFDTQFTGLLVNSRFCLVACAHSRKLVKQIAHFLEFPRKMLENVPPPFSKQKMGELELTIKWPRGCF